MSQYDKLTLKDGSYLHFKDWGSGQPIVFSHGWPLTIKCCSLDRKDFV